MSGAERLKELNKRSNQVAKEVKEASDSGIEQAIVAELANYAYEKGLEDARKEFKEALEPVNAMAQRKGL
ncbi:hypothetical protein ABEW00_21995 [Rossellomorea vietnamensis]|uniref:hypothetical protein n=1 Tax=Rossellomorea vietnamensis TaxID=218284 RepID=UPI003D26E5A8